METERTLLSPGEESAPLFLKRRFKRGNAHYFSWETPGPRPTQEASVGDGGTETEGRRAVGSSSLEPGVGSKQHQRTEGRTWGGGEDGTGGEGFGEQDNSASEQTTCGVVFKTRGTAQKNTNSHIRWNSARFFFFTTGTDPNPHGEETSPKSSHHVYL